jgi:hemerythrin
MLAWKDQFIIDNGPIDRDHKMLVVRINNVLRRLNGKAQADAVLKDIFSLRAHAEFHFKREESLQEQAGYPGLAEHAAEHRQLLAQIDGVLDEIEALPPEAVVPEQRKKKTLFYRWILHHLIDTDQKIKPFIEKLNGASEGLLEDMARKTKVG